MVKTTSKKSDQGNTVTLSFHPRPRVGTTGARAERHAGRIPAVIYGHGADAISVSLESRALDELMHSGRRNQLIDARIDGRTDTVLLRAIQRDPVSRRVIHADFQRVDRTETIYATVRISTVGTAPGVKDFGGVLDVITHELEIFGPADQVPDHLEIDVSALGLHEHVTAGEVKLPGGFTISTPPSTVVVAVEASRTAQEAEAAATPAPAEEAAVPTVGETEKPAEPT
jgi:large subunit ribosomal protein L25